MRQYISQLFLVLSILLFMGASNESQAQLGVYLQIEILNSAKTIKFSAGQELLFQANDYPDEWRTQRIKEILVDEKVIVFDDGFYHIDQINAVKLVNRPARFLGKSLFTFGGAWNIFGILAQIGTDFNFSKRDIIIGTSTMAAGFAIDRAFRYKKYNVKKGSRLRIVDIRFKVD